MVISNGIKTFSNFLSKCHKVISNIEQKSYEKLIRQIMSSKLIGNTSPCLIWDCLSVHETNVYMLCHHLQWCSDTKSISPYDSDLASHKDNIFFPEWKRSYFVNMVKPSPKATQCSQHFSENNAFLIKTPPLQPWATTFLKPTKNSRFEQMKNQ